MSIVKIQRVNRIDKSIKYASQEHKTNSNLITTFDCDPDYIIEDFNQMYEDRKRKLRKETTNKAKMIIQSFNYEDNITPEEAHEIGVKLADNYLKGNHKYIVITHTDSDYLHNHIIFNEVRNDNLLMFDTTRKNTIDNLRLENDKLTKEYGLTIPSKENNRPYLSQQEVETRRRGNSFKEHIENVIDEVVEQVESYEEFIKAMEDLGFKSKEGKHLAFLNKETDRFMRTRTLGMNYTINSLKYRIENKDFKFHKFDFTLKNKRIDTTGKKFRESKGLRMWASRKNIDYLLEISDLVINQGVSLEEIEEMQRTEESFLKDIEKTLNEKDSILYDLNKMESAYQDYKDSASMIAEYKKSDNKKEFKSKNYKGFKKFDNAKRNMYLLKREYSINDSSELEKFREGLIKERNQIYAVANKILRNINKEKEKERTKEKSRSPKMRR